MTIKAPGVAFTKPDLQLYRIITNNSGAIAKQPRLADFMIRAHNGLLDRLGDTQDERATLVDPQYVSNRHMMTALCNGFDLPSHHQQRMHLGYFRNSKDLTPFHQKFLDTLKAAGQDIKRYENEYGTIRMAMILIAGNDIQKPSDELARQIRQAVASMLASGMYTFTAIGINDGTPNFEQDFQILGIPRENIHRGSPMWGPADYSIDCINQGILERTKEAWPIAYDATNDIYSLTLPPPNTTLFLGREDLFMVRANIPAELKAAYGYSTRGSIRYIPIQSDQPDLSRQHALIWADSAGNYFIKALKQSVTLLDPDGSHLKLEEKQVARLNRNQQVYLTNAIMFALQDPRASQEGVSKPKRTL